MKQNVTVRYEPRVWQQHIHMDNHKFRVVICHRTGGKTYLVMGELIKAALTKVGTYVYLAPEKAQGKRVLWDKFKNMIRYDASESTGIPGLKINESELRIDFPNGSTFYILGGDQPENIRGMHNCGVVLDEVADMPMETWETVIRPTLLANDGWGLFIGTPKKGTNLLNRVFELGQDPELPNWHSWDINIYDTGVYTPERIAELKAEMLPSQFNQEFMNRQNSSEGEIYANLLDQMGERGQIGMFPYDERFPVYTGWDIGYNDNTVIWFAQLDPDTNRIYMIDYYKNRRKYMSHYINHLLLKPYRYATAFLPHDIEQTRMDKEYSEIAKMKQAGLKYRVLPRCKNVLQAVQSVQSQINRVFFNKVPCDKGIEDLKQYDTKQDRKTGQYTDKLKHCDTSDAFRYIMEGLAGAKSIETSQSRFKRMEKMHMKKQSSMQIARKRLRPKR